MDREVLRKLATETAPERVEAMLADGVVDVTVAAMTKHCLASEKACAALATHEDTRA